MSSTSSPSHSPHPSVTPTQTPAPTQYGGGYTAPQYQYGGYVPTAPHTRAVAATSGYAAPGYDRNESFSTPQMQPVKYLCNHLKTKSSTTAFSNRRMVTCQVPRSYKIWKATTRPQTAEPLFALIKAYSKNHRATQSQSPHFRCLVSQPLVAQRAQSADQAVLDYDHPHT